MTYNEIYSQITQRVYAGLSGFLKDDVKFAINWAESEILSNIDSVLTNEVLDVDANTGEYSLEKDFGLTDFSLPATLLPYSSENTPLDYLMVGYPEWLAWNPTQSSNDNANDVVGSAFTGKTLVDAAKYGNKIILALIYQKEEHTLCIKPAFNGKIILGYKVGANRDIFTDLTKSPRIPPQLHNYIIPGAINSLTQIEQAKAINSGDTARAQFMANLQSVSYAQFQRRIGQAESKSVVDEIRPVVARPFNLGDNPRKYR